MKEKSKNKFSFRNLGSGFWKLVKGFAFFILILLVVLQYFDLKQFQNELENIGGHDSSFIAEIGQLSETYSAIGGDLNEVRQFLGLEVSNYQSLHDLEIEDSGNPLNTGKNTDQLQLALFQYVGDVSAEAKKSEVYSEKKEYLENLTNSETFQKYLVENELFLGEPVENDSSYSVKIYAGNPAVTNPGVDVLTYYLDKTQGDLIEKTTEEKRTWGEKDYAKVKDSKDFEENLIGFLDMNGEFLIKARIALEEANQVLAELLVSEEIKKSLDSNKAKLAEGFKDENQQFVYTINNSLGEPVGSINLHYDGENIDLNDFSASKKDKEKTDNKNSLKISDLDLSEKIQEFIASLNTKTLIEQKYDEALESLEDTLKDPGFQSVLAESGLEIKEAREDEFRTYFDVHDAEGEHISSIVIEKATGVVNITAPDGTNSQNILFLELGGNAGQKKNLTDSELSQEISEVQDLEDDGFNILIAGKHGNLVDTMIFTHIDEKTKEIKMISIPRDLQYNGRKINSYPYFYGMPELKRVLSDLTGYELDKYILVDMYAFIDVIDLLGGIDIALEKPLVDPTYRVVDNGVESTLNYQPGDYHLSGVQALRIARSRHTSSDFDRAARQQLILESLQNKAKNLGFGDFDTIYELAKAVLDQTESDITLDEAIKYYFKYQSYDIVSNNVMSSGNVLYSPPYISAGECASLVAAAKADGQSGHSCQSQPNAYILLPRNGNWNVIKWFFQENFEESSAV